MKCKSLVLAAAATLALGGAGAVAQPFQQMQHTSFETVSPVDSTQPLGWNPFNGARRRTVGDGLLPELTAAHTGSAVIELTPQPFGPSDFIGYSSNSPLDPNDAVSPKNNTGYLFDPPDGEDLQISGWVMIPATEPVVAQRAGLKLEFRRTADDSVYEPFEWFFIDPANPGSMPGLVGVTTPTGPGVHTNGVWLELRATFHQSQFALNGLGQPNWPLPPENPNAKVSALALRFGSPHVAGARGTTFFDDITVTVGSPCLADFNNSGSVTVQDIFDFLSAYFMNDLSADLNNSNSVTVQDIFDFLALYFAGC
ncbi:MAG: hypothetical protein IT438_02725 [Phycisphaerales bacterium]|nr:hypothetical protein [Phycisphaerales bacterium]